MIIGTGAPIDRVFLEVGPLTMYWYNIIIAVGTLLAAYLATREAKRVGLDKDIIIDFLVYAVPIATIFARIYYVLFEFDRYASGPFWKVFAIWEGGIAIHGAIIGGIITAIFFTRKRKISFWKFADV
ncbi:prolipoprotein diacylglyceryl transferase family protein [Ornithinibacillus massiliensis]|uniref:prolipoprotein diacylglyceryl transferase family protein n=1 Tax=Ornithinibacillus massiliensis TaxID=1944633 RepID=UPI001FE5043E|nr:prolipoprotein diacylglyceryl transferase family protein [Ornithinibacillus massiliensis]